MSLSFVPNQVLNQNDLSVFIYDDNSLLMDPASITYSVYRVEKVGKVPLAENEAPTRYSQGWYYIPLTISEDWPDAEYRAEFKIVKTVGDPEYTAVARFYVYKTPIAPGSFDEKVFQLISKLRTLLRDNNPDRNYHFRPPRHVEEVNAYTRRIGYIWEDVELAEYLDLGLGLVNASPPLTEYQAGNLPASYEPALLYGAASVALTALATNWVEEEFGYNISGQSLDLQKAQKYQSLADSYDSKFDKILERAKKAHEKHTKGVRQQRYTVSIQGFMGPFLSRNVLSARSWVESNSFY